MLQTLADNQTVAANSSTTWSYSPNSFQKLFLHLEDADWEDGKLTVQVGSKTICNGAMLWGLRTLTMLTSGVESATTGTNGFISLDFGSHQCTNNENLYVTLQATGEITAVDVSVVVNTPGENFPVKITEYSDSTFTSDSNLMALCYDAAKAAIDDDTTRVDIRNILESSSPSCTSASSYFKSLTKISQNADCFGILNINEVPMKTTYNYTPNTMDRIVTVEAMGSTSAQVQQANSSQQIAQFAVGK